MVRKDKALIRHRQFADTRSHLGDKVLQVRLVNTIVRLRNLERNLISLDVI